MSSFKRSSIAVKHSSAGTGPAQAPTNFMNTPTLYQHVQNNLMCAGRQSYFIRVLLVIGFRNGAAALGQEKMRELIANTASRVNRAAAVDKLTGLIVLYDDTHSIQMLEGAEDCVGNYAKRLLRLADEYFKEARIVLVYNSVNQVPRMSHAIPLRLRNTLLICKFFVLLQRLLSKVHYKYAKSSAAASTAGAPAAAVTVKEADQLTADCMQRIYDLCSDINDDDNKIVGKAPINYELEAKQLAFVPTTASLDHILSLGLLQTLHEFSRMYGNVPDHYNYSDHVWPIPHDLIPNHAFDWNKYDINLTFGDRNKGE